MDLLFGDIFRPPDKKWPLIVKLCRTKKDMVKAVDGDPIGEQLVKLMSCFTDRNGDRLYCRADDIPLESTKEYTLKDRLRCAVVEWFLEESREDKEEEFGPDNPWIAWGLLSLARSRSFFVREKLPDFGCFKHYREAKKKKVLPALASILTEPSG